MAELIHSPKPANKWSDYDLQAYNIIITPASPDTFFQGNADPSLDHLDSAILTFSLADSGPFPALPEMESTFRGHLCMAIRGTSQGRTSDARLAMTTLKLLGYQTNYGARAYLGSTIPLHVCGKTWGAYMNVCILQVMTDATLLFIVQGCSKRGVRSEVDARVVVTAIAAFQSNNVNRVKGGRPVLDSMTIPCIALSGTVPSFYLIPVSKKLSDAVSTGQYPTEPTYVSKCVTPSTPQDVLEIEYEVDI